MKTSILQSKLQSYNKKQILCIGSGMDSRMPQSNIYHDIVKCGLNPEDEYKTFEVVIGGRAGKNWNDGYHYAIVKL